MFNRIMFTFVTQRSRVAINRATNRKETRKAMK